MPNIVNWELLKSPVNWFTVWTIVFVLWFLVEAISRHPAASSDNA